MLNRADRDHILRERWDRGDAVADIASAIGLSPAAVYMARSRLALPPRGRATGRPRLKQVRDEPGHKVDRVGFVTSRLMEFCREDELERQTGHPVNYWSRVVFKELVDNALDACEETDTAPVIKIDVTTSKKKSGAAAIVIKDNGPGMPSGIIKGITDYTVRASSREAYVSPTRGAQGNALKTILAMAFVLSSQRGETWIEARGIKHRIRFEVDQIKQEPMVSVAELRSRVRVGTTVTVFWPDDLSDCAEKIWELLVSYVSSNPYLDLTFSWNGKVHIRCEPTNPKWKKWGPRDATGAHWYTLEQFERYAAAHISARHKSGRGKYTVREFVGEFRGMSSTERQREILQQNAGAAHQPLATFFGSSKHVNHDRMERLLSAIQRATGKVRPELLGIIGPDHIKKMMGVEHGDLRSFKYEKMVSDKAASVPYVIEVAFAIHKSAVADKYGSANRRLIQAVNFSAAVGQNLYDDVAGGEGINELLVDLRASRSEPVIVFIHLASPRIRYLDRGKSRIVLED